MLWTAYPVVFLFGLPGADAIGPVTHAALYTILDVAAESGYGLLVTLEDRRLTAAEDRDVSANRPFGDTGTPVLVQEREVPARASPALADPAADTVPAALATSVLVFVARPALTRRGQ